MNYKITFLWSQYGFLNYKFNQPNQAIKTIIENEEINNPKIAFIAKYTLNPFRLISLILLDL